MQELEQREKTDALEAHDAYDGVVDAATVLGPLVSAFAIPPPAGPILGVGIALMSFLCKRQAKTFKRIADDPPDSNYRRPAQRRPLRLRLEWLSHEPPGEEFARAARDLVASEAELRAFIASVEKAAGATLAEQPELRGARLLEARTHAGLGARFLKESEATLGELVEQLDSSLPSQLEQIPEDGRKNRSAESGQRPMLTDLLRDEELALLFRIGVSRANVDVPVPRRLAWQEWPTHRQTFLAQLRAASRATGTIGQTLESWAENLPPSGEPGTSPPGGLRW